MCKGLGHGLKSDDERNDETVIHQCFAIAPVG